MRLSVRRRSDPVLQYGEEGATERPGAPPSSPMVDQKNARTGSGRYDTGDTSKKIPPPTKYHDAAAAAAEVVVWLSFLCLRHLLISSDRIIINSSL